MVGSCNATTPRKSVGADSPWGETGFIPRQRGANMLTLFAGQYLEYLQIILLFWGNLKCEFIESIICQFDARFDFRRSLCVELFSRTAVTFPNIQYMTDTGKLERQLRAGVMHLSMSSSRGGGSSKPREFDYDLYPQGRGFDWTSCI